LFSDEIYLTRLFYFRFSEITLPGSVRPQASFNPLVGALAFPSHSLFAAELFRRVSFCRTRPRGLSALLFQQF
jgi:hypothetical protein